MQGCIELVGHETVVQSAAHTRWSDISKQVMGIRHAQYIITVHMQQIHGQTNAHYSSKQNVVVTIWFHLVR
jgi:hypothetical protein